jgi:hypothetical protein
MGGVGSGRQSPGPPASRASNLAEINEVKTGTVVSQGLDATTRFGCITRQSSPPLARLLTDSIPARDR